MKRDERNAKVIGAVTDLVNQCDRETTTIREKWKDNYAMFCHGTQFDGKESWQSEFSTGKLEVMIRAGAGRVRDFLLNTPEWFNLVSRNEESEEAQTLAPLFEKDLKYLLARSKFYQYASSMVILSFISMATMIVGWKRELVRNPLSVLKRSRKSEEEEQRALAKVVDNAQNVTEWNEESILASLQKAWDESPDLLAGATPEVAEPEEKEYLQLGAFDFQVPYFENVFWDTNCAYMGDSRWRAYQTTLRTADLKRMAKHGRFNKAAVQRAIESGRRSPGYAERSIQRRRFQNVSQDTTADIHDVLVYYGPLILDNEIQKDEFYCIIVNGSEIIKEGDYPFWEPPGHYTPFVDASVKEVPYRATGAGVGDNATRLARTLDSNWTLVADQMRLNVLGANFINEQALVDHSILDELEPGVMNVVRGNPKDVFHHQSFTSNIENQAMPVQGAIENAIRDLTGMNELMTGGQNPYSRTSAAETNARMDGASGIVNSIALDLERQFLVPILEKCFARYLQYALPSLLADPGLRALHTDDELQLLQTLTDSKRLDILHTFYDFKINGFSTAPQKEMRMARINEFLQIVNSGGPLAQIIDFPKLLKVYAREMDIEGLDSVVLPETELAVIVRENQLILTGRPVEVLERDNHELHMNSHQQLASTGNVNDALMQHIQIHAQYLQQQQQIAQQQQQMGPQQAQPPQVPGIPQGMPMQ